MVPARRSQKCAGRDCVHPSTPVAGYAKACGGQYGTRDKQVGRWKDVAVQAGPRGRSMRAGNHTLRPDVKADCQRKTKGLKKGQARMATQAQRLQAPSDPSGGT